MTARRVQVQGCLPSILVLVALGAVLAALVTASLAFVGVAVAAGLVAALVRWVRRLLGARSPPVDAVRRRAADSTIDAELVEPSEGGDQRPPKRLE